MASDRPNQMHQGESAFCPFHENSPFYGKAQCSKLMPALWISPTFQKHHMEARFGMKGKRTNTCHPG